MRMKSQVLEGLENIKVRLVKRLKELKNLLFRVDSLQKMIFAITVMAKVTLVGTVPGTIYLDVIRTLTR